MYNSTDLKFASGAKSTEALLCDLGRYDLHIQPVRRIRSHNTSSPQSHGPTCWERYSNKIYLPATSLNFSRGLTKTPWNLLVISLRWAKSIRWYVSFSISHRTKIFLALLPITLSFLKFCKPLDISRQSICQSF